MIHYKWVFVVGSQVFESENVRQLSKWVLLHEALFLWSLIGCVGSGACAGSVSSIHKN